MFVVVNTIINLAGIGSLKIANRVFLAIELVFVVIFVVIAVRAINGESLPNVGWSTAPIWNSSTVSAPLIAAALSIAVLSFLGFDGISTLAEESTGTQEPAGRAMIIALFVVAVPVRHPDLAGQPARRRPRVVQRRRGGQRVLHPGRRRRRTPAG